MSPKEFLTRWKMHLFFVGVFVFAVALNIMMGFRAGETFLGATWRGILEIRPMDYMTFAIFWYACAVHRPKDDWDTSLVSLNLSQTNNHK